MTLTATVPTTNGSRYLQQLCKHWSHKFDTDFTAEKGEIAFPMGPIRMEANPEALVVTLEPCPMCAGAALAARVPRIVFGAWDPKAGASGSVYDIARDRRLPHRAEVVAGVLEDACAAVLDAFFAERR